MILESAVVPEGRISPDDSGIWSDQQVAGFRGRESLRDASWPLRAAAELGVDSEAWPAQYLRARPRTAAPR